MVSTSSKSCITPPSSSNSIKSNDSLPLKKLKEKELRTNNNVLAANRGSDDKTKTEYLPMKKSSTNLSGDNRQGSLMEKELHSNIGVRNSTLVNESQLQPRQNSGKMNVPNHEIISRDNIHNMNT